MPFQVTDANETFSYKIKFSEYDQSGKEEIEAIGSRINAKIVPYAIYDSVMVLNLILMLFLIIFGSLYIERSLKRGIEAQEKSSDKAGSRDKKEKGKSGGEMASTVLSKFRRK
jgi:hypothetical protein